MKHATFCLSVVDHEDGKLQWSLASAEGTLARGNATKPLDSSVVGRMATAVKRAVFKFDRGSA